MSNVIPAGTRGREKLKTETLKAEDRGQKEQRRTLNGAMGASDMAMSEPEASSFVLDLE